MRKKYVTLDICRTFSFCGITTNNSGKVRNDEFLKKIMNSVKDKLVDIEEELPEYKDPFVMCIIG